MNIEIANICNLKCPYCFAGDHMQSMRLNNADKYLSLELFEQRLDFLGRSNMNELRLIGGEPTLHPQFPKIIELAKQHKKFVMIFSHGLMPEKAISAIEDLAPDEVMVLINMNAMISQNGPTAAEQTRRMRILQRLGERALLGCNIYKTNFDLSFLVPIILDANCKKEIRVGLAHPTVDGDNDYVHPKEYPYVGSKLAQFSQLAGEYGIKLAFDCGFVRCMFSDEALDTLRRNNADIGWRCSPIVDLDTSGQAFHCFPLSEHVHIPIEEVGTTNELHQKLAEKVELYRVTGIYRECASCLYKIQGKCTGGGIEHIMRRFRHTPFKVVVPDVPIHTQEAQVISTNG